MRVRVRTSEWWVDAGGPHASSPRGAAIPARGLSVALSGVLAGALLLAGPAAVRADTLPPGTPSQAQVDAAVSAVADQQGQVSVIEASYAAANARLGQVQRAVSEAAAPTTRACSLRSMRLSSGTPSVEISRA